MLLPHIDNTEHYLIISHRESFSLRLVTQTMLKQTSRVDALWHRVAGDTASFDALLRWCAIRRDRWQEWGQIAEALGRDTFAEHMRERMDAEPVGVCLGTLVRRMADPREILLSDAMQGPQGMFEEPLATHRFASPTVRDRFFEWLFTDDNIDQLNSLSSLGYREGAVALGKSLDEIAATPAAPSPANRRRRSRIKAEQHAQAPA